MVRLAPSVLSCNFLHLEQDVRKMEEARIDLLHIDVMDGMFVPNISFGALIPEHIRKISSIGLDVHLMIEQPNRYFDIFSAFHPEFLTIHAEASTHLDRDITAIQSRGIRAGVALNPSTTPETLRYVMDRVDLVLVMSVNPGFGGQTFIARQLDKVRELVAMRDHCGGHASIEIDGGITAENIREVVDAGVDIAVSGSGLLKGDFHANLQRFEQALR